MFSTYVTSDLRKSHVEQFSNGKSQKNGFFFFFFMPHGIMMLKSYHWITLTMITFEGHLGEPKALRALLNSLQQVGAQLVIGLVGRQVQLIEASVSSGKSISRPIVPVDLELLCAVHSLEGTKALQWDFAGPCDKLKELGSVSLVKASQSSPEPNYLEAGNTVLMVLCVRL